MSHECLSTGCLHGRHDYCQNPQREDGGQKRPAECKFCMAPCICWCHVSPEGAMALPIKDCEL